MWIRQAAEAVYKRQEIYGGKALHQFYWNICFRKKRIPYRADGSHMAGYPDAPAGKDLAADGSRSA